MIELLKRYMTDKKINIRQRMVLIVLSISIITLVILSAVSFYAMMNIKSSAVTVGINIGESAAENSSLALRENAKASLQGLVHERSRQVDYIFKDFVWDVSTLANEMTTILQNPQDYPDRRVSEPSISNAGKIVPQIQFTENFNRSAFRREIGLTANLQDFMVRLNDGDDSVATTHVVSKNGFNILVDDLSDKRINSDGTPETIDYRTRIWYQTAAQAQKLTFSDIFVDLYGRGLAISCAAPYFDINNEFAGVVAEGRLLADVGQIVNKTEIGETGFGFIVNERGQILFSPKTEGSFAVDYDNNLDNDPSLFDNEEPTLAQAIKRMAAGATGIDLVNIDGTSYYLAYSPLGKEGWSFGAVIEESEVIMPAEASKYVIEESTEKFVSILNDSIRTMITAVIVVFFTLLFIEPIIGRKIAERFVKPIHQLSDGVREITSGNLDKKLDIHTGDEIEHLATCFNAMTDELKTYMSNLTKITAEKERIATELDVAKNIQTSMLPNIFPPFPDRSEFEIYATMNAAKEVGGDFYDFYLLDENHLVVTIADVSGKGIPAALFMMMSKTILKNFAMTMSTPDDFSAVMTLANNQLCQNNDAMMFVTVFMGMLDTKTGEFTFVNGGHNPPLVYHKSTGSYEYLKVAKNFVLGGMEDIDYKQQKITLEKGDKIFMYTDGVTEALNPTNELYGEERLLECLNRSGENLSVDELLKCVRDDVTAHVDGAEQSDDITMLVIEFEKN